MAWFARVRRLSEPITDLNASPKLPLLLMYRALRLLFARTHVGVGLLFGAVCLVTTGCFVGSASPTTLAEDDQPLPARGHDRMLVLLSRDRERGYRNMRFVGDERSRRMRRKLAKLKPAKHTKEYWKLHERLGVAELRLGHEADGLALIRKAYDCLPHVPLAPEQKNQTRFLLAVAHMRLAETENCCHRNQPGSCLLPITATGLHQRREHTMLAIKYFHEAIANTSANSPMAYEARWLLNIAYMAIDGYPGNVPDDLLIPPSVFQSEYDFPPFPNIAANWDWLLSIRRVGWSSTISTGTATWTS